MNGSGSSKCSNISAPVNAISIFANKKHVIARVGNDKQAIQKWWDALSDEKKLPYEQQALANEEDVRRKLKEEREQEAAGKVCHTYRLGQGGV